LGQLKARLAKLRTELQTPTTKVRRCRGIKVVIKDRTRRDVWPWPLAGKSSSPITISRGSQGGSLLFVGVSSRESSPTISATPTFTVPQGATGEGFEVQKYGDGRVALIGEQ
jgi:ribosome-interacting GTPase 1